MLLEPTEARADFTLTILHTNDFHYRIGPIDRLDNDCPSDAVAAADCIGGSARLKAAIAAIRERDDHVVLLDAGDQFPSPAYPTDFDPSLSAELMNRMGYDAMVLGNHEFDEGPEVLGEFISGLRFPVVVANADLSSHPQLDGKTYGSVVLELGDEQLGVIGLTLPHNREWRKYTPRITGRDATEALRAEVDSLAGKGINKIVLISHSGFGGDLSLAAKKTGVDVIVGGHSHTFLSGSDPRAEGPYPRIYNGVAIVQAYAFGAYLGELEVIFDDDGKVVEAVGEPIPLDQNVAEDEEIMRLIAETAR
ncbi:metallophosphoesterase [Aliiruegeria sabulilitoris]|uniref:metallophosphoesterase n=1 Tax=Aliiruegeria sabulilitoris TaxID=1510458 RepID=UPI00082BA5BE|nr:metallophosphoesterase [Aliiruegeria sabulilitoris]